MCQLVQKCACLLLLIYTHASIGTKLNVPRVLLPYNNDIPSNFTLKVFDGGCYKWSTSRDEVIIEEVQKEDGCSKEAVVSAITRSPSRQTAIILARDDVTGETLRCDVIIDMINRLEIVTTTRELYVEEAPEVFEVRAYDDQGNEFTILEGIEFVWDLQTITDRESVVAAQNVIRFITFTDSPYQIPPAIKQLEDQQKQGDMVLIEGKQTGIAKVSVRLSHSAYRDLEPTSVNLMVIANLFLEPSDIYILAHTSVEYSVSHLKQGFLHPIDLPSSHYYLQVGNDDIANLESDGTTVTGRQIGTTLVTLLDKNVKSSERVKQPTAHLNVVEPSYLTVTIVPHNNPSLIRGKNYAFIINIYDKNNNKIFLTDNLVVETHIPEEYYNTEFISNNGTYLYGVPIKTGRTKITAKLSAIKGGDTILMIEPPLMASQALEIFDPLEVIPPITVLPWDPVLKPLYTVNLTALGGSGSVTWSSSDSDLVSVSQIGQCRTKGLGSVQVVAAMTTNLHNKDHAKIYIVEALELSILDAVVEAEVNQALTLPVALYTNVKNERKGFTLCHQLPFQVKPIEHNFDAFADAYPSEVTGACAAVKIVASSPGFSIIEVAYNASKEELKASTLVSAYNPLRPINPSSGITVLAPGSSRTVLFQGGPLPWISKTSGHFTKVSKEYEDTVEASLIKNTVKGKHKDVYAVLVHCNGLGESKVTLEVGNKKSSYLPYPQSATSSVTVVCAVPDSIELSTAASSSSPSCPVVAELGMAVGLCYKPLPIQVNILDSEQRTFDNISSLSLTWSVSNPQFGSFPVEGGVSLTTESLHGFQVPLATIQVFNPKGEIGELSVSAQVLSYKNPYEIALDSPLSATLPLKLVQDPIMSPKFATLYNHNKNLLEISVNGGSGYFGVMNDNENIIKVSYNSKDSKVLVIPINDGNATVSLIDHCLDFDHPVQSHVKVSSLASLDLIMLNKVEVGGTLETEVIALDSLGGFIPSHSLMDLTPHPQSNIISAKFKHINENGNAVYLILGRHIGDTTFKVSATRDDSMIYSPIKPIQVFPPLTLSPKNITLIVGAVYHVETNGGPYPDASIEYVMSNDTVASTSHSGVVTALVIGTTILIGRAVGEDGVTLYSEDTVYVNVIPLHSIKIHSALAYLETGSEMPLYVMGLDDGQTPVSYASAFPSLNFEWSLTNKQIATLDKPFSDNGIVFSKDNAGVISLTAKKPGSTTVTVRVKVNEPGSDTDYQIHDNSILTSKLEITVFETLKLKYPSGDTENLLMAPNSEGKILTNRDGDGVITYKVNKDCNNNSAFKNIISVDQDGIVRSGSDYGSATVLVSISESFGITQTVVVYVEVKRVVFMMGSVNRFMSVSTSEVISDIPIGATMELVLSHHDNRGRKFHSVNSDVHYRPSRFDLVGVKHGTENNTLIITVRGSGQTVLHIWDENYPEVSDYLRISSGSAVNPHKAIVPLGNHVCFKSGIRDLDGSEGNWNSDNNKLRLNSLSGEGIASQIGKSGVTYQVNSGFSTVSEVQIVPITDIIVTLPPLPITSLNSRIQRADVELISINQYNPSSCNPAKSLDNDLIFSCIVSTLPILPNVNMKELVRANPVYIPEEGYACEFVVSEEATNLLATVDLSVFLEVIVQGHGQQPEVKSTTIAVPFVPAFILDKDSEVLTNENTESFVTIIGTSKLLNEIEISSEDLLRTTIETDGESKKLIRFSLKENIWSWPSPPSTSFIIVHSPSIGQIENITITFNKIGSGTCALPQKEVSLLSFIITLFWHYSDMLFSIICILFTLICIAIGYKVLIGPGYKQTQIGGVFASSKEPAPTVPLSPLNRNLMPEANIAKKLNFSGATSPRTYLWTQDSEPIYGAPSFRSSPRGAYDGSPTYASR